MYGLFADKWLTKLKNDVSGFQTKEDLQMKKLFLSSFFTDVSRLFAELMNDEHKGKRVTFIPTAANPEKIRFFVEADRKALQSIDLIVDETDIANCSREEISAKLNENDYIFICGGNTFYLLQELKRKKIDSLIV